MFKISLAALFLHTYRDYQVHVLWYDASYWEDVDRQRKGIPSIWG